jgi:nucleotide-binding universal stress UspA family protein
VGVAALSLAAGDWCAEVTIATTTDASGGPRVYRHGMFDTILAGSTGSRGRGAASLAQAIAAATGSRLLLVGVRWDAPLGLTEAHPRAALEHGLRDVRDALAPDAQTQIATDISAAHALRRIAKDEHAGLVVVGSRRRAALQRLASGHAALHVLHGAPCAVAVAPDHLPPCRGLSRIGVGIDGTPESDVALDMAIELARLADAHLVLLSVASDVYAGSPTLVAGAEYLDSYREILDARVRQAQAGIDAALRSCEGISAEGDVQVGDPASELIALGAHCDLLVLGSRRPGPFRRLALGSTSERVIHHAESPVLVPPRRVRAEHGHARREATRSEAVG